jgi:hypothetical protein
MSAEVGKDKKQVPASIVRHGSLRNGWATAMNAELLTANHVQGTGPSYNPASWKLITKRKGHNWVRGHLLNENLGGPGRASNLTPFSKHVNTSEHLPVERELKTAVETKHQFARYGVRVTYGHAKRPATAALEQRIATNKALGKRTRKDKKRLEIMKEEERVVAKRVDLKWRIKKNFQDPWGPAKTKFIAVELPAEEPEI